MSGEGMPKRTRADSAEAAPAPPATVIEISDSPPGTPSTEVAEVVDTTPAHAGRDPILEQQLDALEVDEDFRESIRSMTPNTQRDVLNDIIRHQQHTGVEENLHMFTAQGGDPPGSYFTFSMGGDGVQHTGDRRHDHSNFNEAWEADEEYEDGQEEEAPGEEEEDAPLEPDADPYGLRGAPFGFARAPFSFGVGAMSGGVEEDDINFGRPRMHAFGEQEGHVMDMASFFQLVLGGPTRAQRGATANAGVSPQQARVQERVAALQNLFGMLQQASTMQAMGLDRDVDEMSYEELLELEERIGNVSKGVPPAQLEACMKRVHPAANADETCPICQEELIVATAPSASAEAAPASASSVPAGSKVCVKLLNCPHIFHKSCIKQWLTSNKTCPVCKEEVLPRPGTTSA